MIKLLVTEIHDCENCPHFSDGFTYYYCSKIYPGKAIKFMPNTRFPEWCPLETKNEQKKVTNQ